MKLNTQALKLLFEAYEQDNSYFKEICKRCGPKVATDMDAAIPSIKKALDIIAEFRLDPLHPTEEEGFLFMEKLGPECCAILENFMPHEEALLNSAAQIHAESEVERLRLLAEIDAKLKVLEQYSEHLVGAVKEELLGYRRKLEEMET